VGGVNSPVRSFKSVGGSPRFISRGQGAYLWDADGQRYIDFCNSWGASVLGHAPNAIISAVSRTARKGLTFGAPTELELELGQLIQKAFPSMRSMRLVSSGTEAVMSAIRVARAATQREVIVKFAGCYHGHVDSLLVKAGSGALTLSTPDSAGIPASLAQRTRVLPYNDVEAARIYSAAKGNPSPRLLWSLSRRIWGSCRPAPDFWKNCAHSPRPTTRSSSSMKSSPVSA